MLAITVQNEKQNLQLDHSSGVIEFGRGPQRPGIVRCTIDDATVSRDQLQVEAIASGRVRIVNLSQRAPVDIASHPPLGIGEAREFTLPISLTIGQTLLGLGLRGFHLPHADTQTREIVISPPSYQVGEPAMSKEEFAAEGFQTIAQPVAAVPSLAPNLPSQPLGATPTPHALTLWMETILALQRSGSEPEEFFRQATQALVSMIGLDVGLVLMFQNNNWKVVARSAREGSDESSRITGREFSQTVLRQVMAERRTFFQDLALMRSQESLRSVDAVVASPIFLNETIPGVLYGLRRSKGRGQSVKVTELEAQLVQLLAAAVGANLARGEATRTRTQFEQFFSPELVRHLALDPRLLEGRETNVTVMFADVRGFSKYSERLGAATAIRWMNDVLNELSTCVRNEHGVLVDYVGDELMAMWGAPEPQPDQAMRAMRAALAMRECLPILNERWQQTLNDPVRIGIGVNSGTAQVGNVGSKIKFKYGAMGNTVNLASRVQGLTKYLRCGLLIASGTQRQLGEGFVARRVVKTRVVNIETPVDLYEVEPIGTPERQKFFAESEAALNYLEAGNFALSAQMAGTLLTTNVGDGPLSLTLSRAADGLMKGSEGFDPVWVPPGK